MNQATVVPLKRPPTQREIAAQQRAACEKNIADAAGELEIIALELKAHPGDIALELCDDLHALLGRIEANAQLLNAAPETGEQENAEALAHEREQAARRQP